MQTLGSPCRHTSMNYAEKYQTEPQAEKSLLMRLQAKVCKKGAGCHITKITAKPKSHGNI